MIAAFLLNERGLGLKELAFNRLGVEMTPIAALIGTGRAQRTMADVPVEQAAPYACADADMTLRLRELFAPDIEEGFHRIFYEMEMPLVPVLMAMERWGIALDTEFLGGLARRMGQQLGELELAIYNDVGHAFNINSTQQLAGILYQELSLPHRGRTKTGYSTDAAVLETLRGVHPVVDHLLEYRQLQKLKSTYVDALPPLVNPATGRIHTCFHQTGAATGRVSSSDPNLQNIPVRTEEGRGIRRAFVARGDGQGTWRLVSADYSQIELRVLAHLSGDPALLDSFQRNEDIHTATAAAVYGLEPSQVASEHRRVAKMVNFGVIYGLSDFGLSQGTGLSREESAQFIREYFARYAGARAYTEGVKETARRAGYVTTLLGRRRPLPELLSTNHQARMAAERVAVNTPVQGTAAEIIKLAMVELHRRLEAEGMRTRMLLQVHDELIFEVPEEEMADLRRLALEVMPAPPGLEELRAPLVVDLRSGDNWGDLE
ncbi:MAG: DNA polymerase I [Chloroflexi bacterium]|nr:DNA polymerase I [Chloroflexota bacterium]